MPHFHTIALSFLIFAYTPFAGAAGSIETVTVVKVIDGDTVTVKFPDGKTEKVRIIGIDSPESVDPRKPVQCFAKAAQAELSRLIEGKSVSLERNPAEDRDKYARLLRYISLDGNDVGASMIGEGFAFSYKKFPHPRLSTYNTLEKSARSASKGLWSACGSSEGAERATGAKKSSPGATGEQRQSKTSTLSTQTEQCPIKGNISSKKEKIYHLPTCGSYAETKIDPSAGERWFCTEQEAVAAGWRRAGNCR